jgi:hypothetical protein
MRKDNKILRKKIKWVNKKEKMIKNNKREVTEDQCLINELLIFILSYIMLAL